MTRATILKIAQTSLIIALCVGADQATKRVAEARLASARPGLIHHPIVLTATGDDPTVSALLSRELRFSDAAQREVIARVYTQDPAGQQLRGADALTPGQRVHVLRREVVLIPDRLELQYARNPGAAFGLLADAGGRRPFLLVAGGLVIALMLALLRGATMRQQLLICGVALSVGGALGNAIDRFRLGYVIDFIVVRLSPSYAWPTFNLADVWISIGAGLLLIVLTRELWRGRRERAASDEAASS